MDDTKAGTAKQKIDDKAWEPAAPSAEEELTNEKRSLDIGESGQHAPGGYYNQQEISRPDRSALDPDEKSHKF